MSRSIEGLPSTSSTLPARFASCHCNQAPRSAGSSGGPLCRIPDLAHPQAASQGECQGVSAPREVDAQCLRRRADGFRCGKTEAGWLARPRRQGQQPKATCATGAGLGIQLGFASNRWRIGPGPSEGRVLRGGSWNNNPQNCRSAYRNRNNPDNRNDHRGFRVLLHFQRPGTRRGCARNSRVHGPWKRGNGSPGFGPASFL